MFDKAVLSHAEDLELTHGGVMNEGFESMRLGLRGMPAPPRRSWSTARSPWPS